MTFKQVAIKSFLKQIKSYLGFYLCSTFCVIVFFMYSTIIFNDQLNSGDNADVLLYVFPISIVAIGLFSIFFINYAHATFLKSRNKEFGVFLSLGMNAKELKNLVLFDNILISMAAIVSGIFVGALFSRLFQMILISLMEIEKISFSLDFRAFITTILTFGVIFAMNFVLMARKLMKSDILTLLTEARKSQTKMNPKKNAILGCVGIIILVISLFYLIAIAKNEDWYSNPLMTISYMLIAFFGVYLTISEGGIFLLLRIKKSKYYYSNLLSITQLQHKYRQNKKIMFILAILSTMIIFFVGSPYSLLSLCESLAKENKYDLEFVVADGIHDNYEEVLRNYLTKEEMKEQIEIPLLLVQGTVNGERQSIPMIDVETYNNYMNTNLMIPEGGISNLMLDWIPSDGGYSKGDQFTFDYQNQSYSYEVVSSANGKFIATAYGSPNLLVVSKTDYEKLESKATSAGKFTYQLINFDDWTTKREAVLNIEKIFGDKVGSVARNYLDLKEGYSVFFFVFALLGVLFFVAGGSVLYFRQFAELPEAKKTFAQLFKIGISFKETKTIISKQLFVIFYVPVVFGAYLGLSLIFLMTHLMGGENVIREFMINATMVALLYVISQCIFYFLTRRKYLNSIGSYCIQGEQ